MEIIPYICREQKTNHIMSCITQIALNDITKHVKRLRLERLTSLLKYERVSEFNLSHDSWVVGRQHINTKETTRLNRILGIHKLNK